MHIFDFYIFKFIFSSQTCINFSNSGNHERDTPGIGSFYNGNDAGGECGVLVETMFYVPAENRAKFW